jgi:hypothetical protein
MSRFEKSGLTVRTEQNTNCCHARQNKVWTTEPQGLAWEWYRVLDDPAGAQPPPAEVAACCTT